GSRALHAAGAHASRIAGDRHLDAGGQGGRHQNRLNSGETYMQTRELGIAVVGTGRIGSLRARLAAAHPSGKFRGVSDLDAERGRRVGKAAGANLASGSNDEVISHPDVNAVIVSTSEHEHLEPVMQALELGKPVLVEKPIALTLADADRIIAKSEAT